MVFILCKEGSSSRRLSRAVVVALSQRPCTSEGFYVYQPSALSVFNQSILPTLTCPFSHTYPLPSPQRMTRPSTATERRCLDPSPHYRTSKVLQEDTNTRPDSI